MNPIRTEINNGVALITLDNPPLNLVTIELTKALDRILDELAINSDVLVLVLTGAGDRAFCAGSDILEFSNFIGESGQVLERKLIAENEMYSKLDHFPKPTIAAINAPALGGGLELAVCCDLLVIGKNVNLSLPEIKLGVFPGSGGTIRVTRRIGIGRAKQMMLLGEPVDAATALEWGLVNWVVEPGKAQEKALEIASIFVRLPNRALQICKTAIELSVNHTEEEAIKKTLLLSEIAFKNEDAREGVRAFLSKEKPNFNKY